MHLGIDLRLSTTMTTPLVLRYFDIRARAEPLRLLLVDAGVDFVDERVPYDDDWKTKGALEQPFRLLPTLDVIEADGKTFRLPETIPITEYIEETYGVGLQQRTSLERAKVNAIRDVRAPSCECRQQLDRVTTSLRPPSVL